MFSSMIDRDNEGKMVYSCSDSDAPLSRVNGGAYVAKIADLPGDIHGSVSDMSGDHHYRLVTHPRSIIVQSVRDLVLQS